MCSWTYLYKSLMRKNENKFLWISLPNKFKIGVFGCVNSYGKVQSNDLEEL